MIWIYNYGHIISTQTSERTNYLVLSEVESQFLKKAIQAALKKVNKRVEKLRDIHESGEATSRQQTDLVKAEEEQNLYQGYIKIIGE